MEREIIITADGSSTIHLPEWDEQYHSKHGAIQEAYHVFIKQGLEHFYNEMGIFDDSDLSTVETSATKSQIAILEIGFGTGLNAFITLIEAEKLNCAVNYCGVEAYPIAMKEVLQLNYTAQLNTDSHTPFFKEIHDLSWEKVHAVTPHFSLIKQNRFFFEINEKDTYNIIYFDAFGAQVQPELWTETIFKKMYDALQENGILVTYAAKGSVRRAMQAVGFTVERLPGPPGKREMLRAGKRL